MVNDINRFVLRICSGIINREHVRIIDVRELYALHEQEHLRRLLPYPDVDCVFDVGANVGSYGQKLRKRAGFKGRIISFEPIPWVADQLRQKAQQDDL